MGKFAGFLKRLKHITPLHLINKVDVKNKPYFQHDDKEKMKTRSVNIVEYKPEPLPSWVGDDRYLYWTDEDGTKQYQNPNNKYDIRDLNNNRIDYAGDD